MKCPFWSNYWYEPCQSCDCRIDKSVSMEIDAMFFLRNAEGKTMAMHIEMKRDREPLSIGIDPGRRVYGTNAACEKRFWATIISSQLFFVALGRIFRWLSGISIA